MCPLGSLRGFVVALMEPQETSSRPLDQCSSKYVFQGSERFPLGGMTCIDLDS